MLTETRGYKSEDGIEKKLRNKSVILNGCYKGDQIFVLYSTNN